MIEIKPPLGRVTGHYNSVPLVFLGGSIEMGTADDWQLRLSAAVQDLDCVLANPRRDHWDTSWEQRERNPQFAHQVNWELDHLENSDIAVFYFDPKTKSPITLMELGLMAGYNNTFDSLELTEDEHRQTILVCCPDGFWRKGNVEIICSRAAPPIPVLNTFEELVGALRAHLIARS